MKRARSQCVPNSIRPVKPPVVIKLSVALPEDLAGSIINSFNEQNTRRWISVGKPTYVYYYTSSHRQLHSSAPQTHSADQRVPTRP